MTSPRAVQRSLAPLLAALAMFGPFAIDTMFPAFPAIAEQFAASPLAMQQTLSVYMIAYALMSLLHGPLSDAVGRRPVILGGVAIFVLASIGCALSRNITELLLFRALQGLSAGAGLIVGRAIIRDCYEGAEAQKLMATVSMIFGVAPAIAPIIGGWVVSYARWPMIFWLLAGFAAILWVFCLRLLPETHPQHQRVVLSMRTMLHTYAHIARDRGTLALVLAGTLGFNALFVYIASAPAFVLDLLKLSEREFAWLFIPAISGLMLGSFLSGRLAGRIDAVATIRIGYSLMLGATVANIGVALLLPQPLLPWSVLPIALHSMGIGIAFPTLTLLLLDRYPQHRGGASSVQAFVSLVFSALIAGVLSPLVSGSALALACTAGAVTVIGFGSWLLCCHLQRSARNMSARGTHS